MKKVSALFVFLSFVLTTALFADEVRLNGTLGKLGAYFTCAVTNDEELPVVVKSVDYKWTDPMLGRMTSTMSENVALDVEATHYFVGPFYMGFVISNGSCVAIGDFE